MKPFTQRDLLTLPASDGWIRSDLTRSDACDDPPAPSADWTMRGIASTGEPEWFGHPDDGGRPVVVDLDSLRYRLPLKLCLDHGDHPAMRLGEVGRLAVVPDDSGARYLLAWGRLDPEAFYFDYVRDHWRGGGPWYLSAHLKGSVARVDEPCEVNGRLCDGPIYVGVDYELAELSLVKEPADPGATCLLCFP